MNTTVNTPEALPEWVRHTPADHAYVLEMFESGDSATQAIDLTREEFMELKRHLAAKRGLIDQEQLDKAPQPGIDLDASEAEWSDALNWEDASAGVPVDEAERRLVPIR